MGGWDIDDSVVCVADFNGPAGRHVNGLDGVHVGYGVREI